jgi:hypothetical protein
MCAQQCKIVGFVTVVMQESCSDDQLCQHLTEQCEHIAYNFVGN